MPDGSDPNGHPRRDHLELDLYQDFRGGLGALSAAVGEHALGDVQGARGDRTPGP